MQLAKLLGPDLDAALTSDPAALADVLAEFPPEDVAEIVSELSADRAALVVRALPNDLAANVTEHLSEEMRADVLRILGTVRAAAVVTEMSADDRADTLQEMPSEMAQQILAHIEENEPEVAEATRQLAAYPAETAGGLMTTEYVSLAPDTKVWEAIEEVRRLAREGAAETVYAVFVIAFGGKLVGVVSLRDLILHDPGKDIADIMTEHVLRVLPTADQEEVARTIAKYDLNQLPVVDEQGKMLGIVTVDDVVDVVIREATEDAQKMGAVEPIDDAYFATSVLTFVKKRAPWLVVLFFAEMLTATVMQGYERDLAAAIDLVLFIPLIISSGGNSGSQSSSLVIRGLAVGEVRPRDWLRLMSIELRVGVCLSLLLGAVGVFGAYIAGPKSHAFPIAAAVGCSVSCVVMLGVFVGSTMPLIIKKVGLDPAVSSTPFIASLLDVMGLVLYFTVAKAVLAILM